MRRARAERNWKAIEADGYGVESGSKIRALNSYINPQGEPEVSDMIMFPPRR